MTLSTGLLLSTGNPDQQYLILSMRCFYVALLISNVCLAQFETKWVKPIKLDSVNADGEIFYGYADDKIYLLNVHAFYKSETTNNPDGSIRWSYGPKNSVDSLQKASIYKLEGNGSLVLEKQFEFSPKSEIKEFIVTGTDNYFVYGAEQYLFGKKISFIKEWKSKNSFSEFSFSAESSSNIGTVFKNGKLAGVIAYQNNHPLNRPVFFTVNTEEKKFSANSPDSIRSLPFFKSAFANDQYYIAGNCRIHTDTSDRSPMYSRLLVFDKNGALKKGEDIQLDDPLHHFDVRSLSVQNEEVVITGLLYSSDFMNRERSWIVKAVKLGKPLWTDTLPGGYMPQSVHHAGNDIILVAIFTNRPGKGYNSYHLFRYDKDGRFIENFTLTDIKPEWKNVVVVHSSEKKIIIAGKNIFNSLVIEKIAF